MFSPIIEYLRDEEDKQPSFIRLTRNIVLFVIFTNLALLPLVSGLAGEYSWNPTALAALSITLILELIALLLVQRGRVGMAKLVVPIGLLMAATVIALNTNGLKNTAIVGFPIILMIAAILLGRRAFVLITPLAIIALVFIAIQDFSDNVRRTPAGIDDAIILPVLILATAGITNLLIRRLNESLANSRESEKIQREANIELNQLRSSLEERVRQRTVELEEANRTNERRARQFKAVAEVMKAISDLQDLDTLLPRITQLISEEFGTYHTGIFLIDSQHEFAVLRAANSEGGQRMLVRGHKLQVGQKGIVGFVTATGQPRIALDVGMDAVFFDNPDLPDTRSEIALPLQFAGHIIGALDVQSTQSNAFSEDDVEVLSTLADQVSVAINNALTIERAQQSLAEAQSALGVTTREAWQVMRPQTFGLGLQLSESNVKPLEQPLEGNHIQDAIKYGRTMLATSQNRSVIAIPVRLRGQVIGVMQITARESVILSEDDTEIAEAVAQRLSLAIESATLLQATQQRADIERITSMITSRISTSTRFETILQTAAQELSRALGGSDVLVQIEPVALELSVENQ